jgi:hypothetical protein
MALFVYTTEDCEKDIHQYSISRDIDRFVLVQREMENRP